MGVEGKGMAKTVSGKVQGDERKRTIDDVSKTKRRCRNWRRTPLQDKSRGEPVYCLGGVRHKGGVNLSQSLVWNAGTCSSYDKGDSSVKPICLDFIGANLDFISTTMVCTETIVKIQHNTP